MRFSTFFSNLEMKNQKWTKINVHFQNFQNRFEKHYIIHLFGIRRGHSLSIFGIIYICKGLKEPHGRAGASAYEK
jgi:hypothetical protein